MQSTQVPVLVERCHSGSVCSWPVTLHQVGYSNTETRPPPPPPPPDKAWIAPICTKGRKEMFYLTSHSTHFIYGYMVSDIWLRTILIVREETRCRHIGYSFRLAARVLKYVHHPTDRIAHTTAFVTPVVEHWLEREIAQWVHPMKDRSDDPSHHERTLYL